MAKNRMPRGGMPRGNMGGVNMNQLMQQAKKMQEQLAEAQDKAKDIEVSASAGGGMVKVVASATGLGGMDLGGMGIPGLF